MKQLFFFLCCCFSIAGAQTREFEVNFDTDSYHLSSEQFEKLEAFIASLPVMPEHSIVNIAGHTDNVGELAYNAVLSDNRANAIGQIFKNKGFPEPKILTSGRGEVHPIANNKNEIGKAKNRRVVIKVTADDLKVRQIGGLTLKESVYQIDAQKPKRISYESGTKIQIPANAFVDKNGKIIRGNVEVKYIEYRDPIDFILSDVSMEHGDGFFNSGGMFKIVAYQDNKEVFLKKGQQIDIDFSLTGNLPNMAFYQYDTGSRSWNELSKLPNTSGMWPFVDDVVQEDDEYRCPTDACDVFNLLKTTSKRLIGSGVGARDDYREQKKEIARFFASHPETKKDIPIDLLLGTEYASSAEALKTYENWTAAHQANARKWAQEIKLGSSFGLERINKSSRRQKFKITVTAPSAQIDDLDNTVWIHKGVLPENAFTKKWASCAISRQQDRYVVTLKDNDETLVVKDLKLSNRSARKNRKSQLIATMNQALAKQAEKIQDLENQKAQAEKMATVYRRKVDRLKKGDFDQGGNDFPMKCFWQESRKYMTPNEKAMFAEEWLDYFDANKTTMAARYQEITLTPECLERLKRQQEMATAQSNADALTQSLKISSLGIYNCDQVERLDQPLIVDMQYRDENGKIVKPVMIYLVDSKINGILVYNGYRGFSPSHFAYSPNSENTLLAFAGDDSYIVSKDMFKKTTTAKSPFFILKKVEKIKKKKDLTALF
jgi:hypothetical protein